MSLFENNQYRWRETCFVMLSAADRPTAEAVRRHFTGQFEIGSEQSDEEGRLETMTLFSPHDFSAMDICYVDGEDVTEQLGELLDAIEDGAEGGPDESDRVAKVAGCDARLDVLHFERVIEAEGEDEDEFLDPGSLLLVLEQLAALCDGVGVDPQSGSII